MENASKALIIAGAILLSILIIALGIYIYNQAKSAMNTDSLTSVELSTFNDPITQYEGYSKIGSNVQALLSSLISNATTNSGASEKLPTVIYKKGQGSSVLTNTTTYKNVIDNTTSSDYTMIIGGGKAVANNSDYKTALTNLRKDISSSHNYSVSMDFYNSSGYISQITIDYDNSGKGYETEVNSNVSSN